MNMNQGIYMSHSSNNEHSDDNSNDKTFTGVDPQQDSAWVSNPNMFKLEDNTGTNSASVPQNKNDRRQKIIWFPNTGQGRGNVIVIWGNTLWRDDNLVAWGTIQHIAYHPFKYPDILPDIWYLHQSDNGWMQQGGPDPAVNYQIIMVCEVTLTKGHWLWRIHMKMNHMSIVKI